MPSISSAAIASPASTARHIRSADSAEYLIIHLPAWDSQRCLDRIRHALNANLHSADMDHRLHGQAAHELTGMLAVLERASWAAEEPADSQAGRSYRELVQALPLLKAICTLLESGDSRHQAEMLTAIHHDVYEQVDAGRTDESIAERLENALITYIAGSDEFSPEQCAQKLGELNALNPAMFMRQIARGDPYVGAFYARWLAEAIAPAHPPASQALPPAQRSLLLECARDAFHVALFTGNAEWVQAYVQQALSVPEGADRAALQCELICLANANGDNVLELAEAFMTNELLESLERYLDTMDTARKDGLVDAATWARLTQGMSLPEEWDG